MPDSSHCRLFFFGTALIFGVVSLYADVSTVMFQSNMVLQQEMPVPVFGTASSGENVIVSFGEQSKSAETESNGNWQVTLDPMKAGGPFEMTVKGKNTLTFKNVMVGEVWLCAGQSNMAYPIKRIGGSNVDSASKADYPDIRILTMNYNHNAKWQVLTPGVALSSSATAFYFGKNIHQTLDVPVGLIVSANSSTDLLYWLDPEVDSADGKCYNGLIKPVIPYGIRGAIWYQGESDTKVGPREYKTRFPSLINTYRKHWNQGNFPFFYVQISVYGNPQKEPGKPSNFALVRDAQTQTLSLPNTAMAVTIDIGDGGWHPVNKWDVGKRLALPARYLVYGRTQDSAYSGPMLRSCQRRGNEVFIHFNHAYGGLMDKEKNGLQESFALCGADNKWYWAKGVIRNDTVVLSCDQVNDPDSLRYAWADYPISTPLYNGAGLPAVPFQIHVPPEGSLAIDRSNKPIFSHEQRALTITPILVDVLGRSRQPILQNHGIFFSPDGLRKAKTSKLP